MRLQSLSLIVIDLQSDILSCSTCKTKQIHEKKVWTSTELATEVTVRKMAEKKPTLFFQKSNSATILLAHSLEYLQQGCTPRTIKRLSSTTDGQSFWGSSPSYFLFPQQKKKLRNPSLDPAESTHQDIKMLKLVRCCKLTQATATYIPNLSTKLKKTPSRYKTPSVTTEIFIMIWVMSWWHMVLSPASVTWTMATEVQSLDLGI